MACLSGSARPRASTPGGVARVRGGARTCRVTIFPVSRGRECRRASDASTSRLRGCVGDAPPSRTAGASPSRATRRIVRSARLARSGRARGARRGATAVRTAEATTIGARWREERRGRRGSSRNDARRRVDPRPRARSVTTGRLLSIFRTVRRKRKRNHAEPGRHLARFEIW